jgi:hypothetical protein
VVVIERRFARLLSYKMVFFANEASLHRVAENLRPTELARFFYMTEKLDGSRFVIGRDRNRTVCNDLRQPLEKMWKGLAHCSRTDIRRAERLVARVRITCNEEASREDFLAVFNDFARLKDGVRQISSRILQRYERFTDRLVLYLDGQPMVVNLVLRDPESGRVRGLYSGSRRLDTDDPKKARLVGNLNRMLHWHNMRLYKRRASTPTIGAELATTEAMAGSDSRCLSGEPSWKNTLISAQAGRNWGPSYSPCLTLLTFAFASRARLRLRSSARHEEDCTTDTGSRRAIRKSRGRLIALVTQRIQPRAS